MSSSRKAQMKKRISSSAQVLLDRPLLYILSFKSEDDEEAPWISSMNFLSRDYWVSSYKYSVCGVQRKLVLLPPTFYSTTHLFNVLHSIGSFENGLETFTNLGFYSYSNIFPYKDRFPIWKYI